MAEEEVAESGDPASMCRLGPGAADSGSIVDYRIYR